METDTPTVRHFILPPDQVERLREAGGPLADRATYPTLEGLKAMICPVVEIEGRIVAYWILWQALHAEPLWIAPEHRTAMGVSRALVAATFEAIARTGERTAFATVEDATASVIVPYAERLGFQAAPGKLFYIVLEE